MGSARCDVSPRRSGTSGSRICCSSFCFRDVQGLNGFISRVCMSLQFSRLSRLLLPTDEGNSSVLPHVADILSTSPRVWICTKVRSDLLHPRIPSRWDRAACAVQPLAKQIQPPALGLVVGCPIDTLLRVSYNSFCPPKWACVHTYWACLPGCQARQLVSGGPNFFRTGPSLERACHFGH